MCSCDQSLVTLAFLWEKLSQPQFYKDLTRKTAFSEGWSWFKFYNSGLALGTNLKFYTSVAKGLKLKVKRFWGLILTFAEVTGKNLVGEGAFCPPPPLLILIGLNMEFIEYFESMKESFFSENKFILNGNVPAKY